MKKILLSLLSCLLLSEQHIALAASATTNTQSTAKINAVCQFSAANIDVGQIPPTAGWTKGSGNIAVTCSNNAPYTIANNTGSISALKMLSDPSGVNKINLFSCLNVPAANMGYANTANCGTDGYSWGYDMGGGFLTAKGTGAVQNWTPVVRIPNGYYVPGVYYDTLTLGISF